MIRFFWLKLESNADYRPLMKMRISRVRKDFGSEGGNYMERDAAGEQPFGNKPMNNMAIIIKRKVLEIGL